MTSVDCDWVSNKSTTASLKNIRFKSRVILMVGMASTGVAISRSSVSPTSVTPYFVKLPQCYRGPLGVGSHRTRMR